MAHPPKSLQGILWSTDVDRLDLEKDKHYIIHQVLIYGDLSELSWLFDTYSKEEVVRVFLSGPAKLYPKEVYHFVKNYLLGLRNRDLDEQDYVTSFIGPVRQRTADRLTSSPTFRASLFWPGALQSCFK